MLIVNAYYHKIVMLCPLSFLATTRLLQTDFSEVSQETGGTQAEEEGSRARDRESPSSPCSSSVSFSWELLAGRVQVAGCWELLLLVLPSYPVRSFWP
jgi:hypothetical protein